LKNPSQKRAGEGAQGVASMAKNKNKKESYNKAFNHTLSYRYIYSHISSIEFHTP
jgi:hypothetical protein